MKNLQDQVNKGKYKIANDSKSIKEAEKANADDEAKIATDKTQIAEAQQAL